MRKKKPVLIPEDIQKLSIEEVESMLSPREITFCKQYIIHLNFTRAKVEAGYAAGTDPNQISRQPIIKHYISLLQKDLSDRLQISQERVIAEIAATAFFNPAELYDEKGKMLPTVNLPPNIVRALNTIEERVVQVGDKGEKVIDRKYKFNDKLEALDMLAKHLGLYEKDNSQRKVFAEMEYYMPSNGRNQDLLPKPIKTIKVDESKNQQGENVD